ncbi:galectin, partial [Elysia marginata]
FSINLCTMPTKDDGDVVLHFNPRCNREQAIVTNSKIGGMWGHELRHEDQDFTIKRGSNFELEIKALERHYWVQWNKQATYSFQHRIPREYVRYLHIEGDFTLTKIIYSPDPTRNQPPSIVSQPEVKVTYRGAPPPKHPAGIPPPKTSAGNPPPKTSAGKPPPKTSAVNPPPKTSAGKPPSKTSAGNTPPKTSAGNPPPKTSAGKPPPKKDAGEAPLRYPAGGVPPTYPAGGASPVYPGATPGNPQVLTAEEAAHNGDQRTLFKISKQVCVKFKNNIKAQIGNKEGQLLTSEAAQKVRWIWTEHINEVLNRAAPDAEPDMQEAEEDLHVTTTPPTKEERMGAIKSL